MTSALANGRARSDIEVLSRGGLPLNEFMDEAVDALSHVVPFIGACLSTMDHTTGMISSTRKLGQMDGRNEHDIEWARIEYGGEDSTAMLRMLATGVSALGMHATTNGEVERSMRMAALLMPHFGFADEARAVFSDRHGAWGAISLFRGTDDEPFSLEEIAFLAVVAPLFTRGIRAGLLAEQAAGGTFGDAEPDTGPAVIIIDSEDRLVQASPGATAHLARLARVPHTADPLTMVFSLVGSARRFARGEITVPPRIRRRGLDGGWLVLHASPLAGLAERSGDVVVTIEQARPHEIVELIAAAFALTARERDVTDLVLHGAQTREIAETMHLSPYTVQDHLKAVFEKAGVNSRRELVARVYFHRPSGQIAG